MYKILKNALMFASAGALLIMSSCNNANSEKAESCKEAEIVASTDSTITAEVDTAVSVAQDTVAKVENDIYDWEEYERFEAEAREQRRGLWQRPDVIEPCVWRKMSKEDRDMHR